MQQRFLEIITKITTQLDQRSPNEDMQVWLNQHWGPGSDTYEKLKSACLEGIKEGWMCSREHGGIAFGRVIKATPETHNFSVDVVSMENVVGPHHVHPEGEIDLVIPVDDDALFDGHGAGWVVYAPESAHCPTVSQGKAIVLYLLPNGAIEFSA